MSRASEDSVAAALGELRSEQPSARDLKETFIERFREVVRRPDCVPIELDGRRLEARRGGTLLGAALRSGVRLMHVCGARLLCTTCRVVVEHGAENLSAMTPKERLSLRTRLALDARTRLACQARVLGRIEASTVFPLCGNLPGES